jgi:hypothetical protein
MDKHEELPHRVVATVKASLFRFLQGNSRSKATREVMWRRLCE